MVVMAIDVGIRRCGYVVCKIKKDSQIELLREEEIKTSAKESVGGRLNFIFEKLVGVVERYRPEILVVEKLYSHYKHPITLGLLSQVKGVVTLVGEKYHLKLYEFSPTRVRKAFVGEGRAKSFQVKKMAENMVGRKFLSLHTADAFSLVVAFLHRLKRGRFKVND